MIQETDTESPNDCRLSALVTMVIIADQSRDQHTGVVNALVGRREVLKLPMSQLLDRLVAVAATESLEQGVGIAKLAVYKPGERPNRLAVSLPDTNINRRERHPQNVVNNQRSGLLSPVASPRQSGSASEGDEQEPRQSV